MRRFSLWSSADGPRPAFSDRAAGERTPLSAACDARDPTRCLLPWPSNVYTVADSSSPTGLRLSLDFRSLPVLDSPASLNRTDGFSVATPLAVGFPKPVDHRLEGNKLTGAVRLFLAQPDRLGRGDSVPLRLSVVNDAPSSEGLLIAYPMQPLQYDADYVAVALDDVKADDGSPFEAPRQVKVALGLVLPTTDVERALAAYHAPIRALLAEAGVELSQVLRVWDFTTRSAASVSAPLLAMRALALETVGAGSIEVEVESATRFANGTAIEVRGLVQGIPHFVETDGGLAWGGDGLPRQVGVHGAPFRAVLPSGQGAYPMVDATRGGTTTTPSTERSLPPEPAS